MKQKGIFLILTAGCLWGLAPLFVGILFEEGVSPFQIAGTRALISCLFYWIVGLLKEGRGIICRPKDSGILIITGAISVGTMYLTYTLSICLFSSSLAVIFLYTAPIYVALYMSVTRSEKISFWQVLGILMILLGTTLSSGLIASEGRPNGMTLLIGSICGISYALVTIFRKTIQAKYSVFQLLAYTTLGASLVLMPFLEPTFSLINGKICICFLGNALICTAMPQFIYLKGLDSGVSGSVGSSLAAVELIVAGLCGTFLLGQELSFSKGLGLAVVFLGVSLGQYRTGQGRAL